MAFHTGAYWKGATDKMDGRPISFPVDWSGQSRYEYLQGYSSETVQTEAEVTAVCAILNIHERAKQEVETALALYARAAEAPLVMRCTDSRAITTHCLGRTCHEKPYNPDREPCEKRIICPSPHTED